MDATHGMLILPALRSTTAVRLLTGGGEGIGTAVAIDCRFGSAAINRTPRHVPIGVSGARSDRPGAWPMWRFLPRKAARAQKRISNSRLGILGGISIIGTTGIVTPMSEEKLETLTHRWNWRSNGRQINAGDTVPGNHGERFVREQMGVDTQAVVTRAILSAT
ncbi:cobalt-precorrin-5B (C(1))-methyltransferase [Salmonella enterica subsp. enterica]|nr:cobalt-precorrin-5B (C(1))-methyltransferase [Salmonella enterica subsp. enterica]